MNTAITMQLSIATVFVQGLLSFFSPCVLPLIPLYFSYLSGGTVEQSEDRTLVYRRKKVIVNTIFFVFGISFAIFILGFGMSVLGTFFSSHQLLFARVGGIIVILLGMYQVGFFGSSAFLSRERRFSLDIQKSVSSPFAALLMGFIFSFSWTPCVGPTLTSVLLLATSAASRGQGFFYIGVYTFGFVLPFLVAGCFTTSVLAIFHKHRNVVRYTVKIGGVLMMLLGVLMVSGLLNRVTGYFTERDYTQENDYAKGKDYTDRADSSEQTTEDGNKKYAIEFELRDQYGTVHRLSDYQGKVVFLNFWATWCPPCRSEMPDIQALYEKYIEENNSKVVILSVATPDYGRETNQSGIETFLEKNGYTYPVLMDEGGKVTEQYLIQAYPTTFMIDQNGCFNGYVQGAMSREMMQEVIEDTLAVK